MNIFELLGGLFGQEAENKTAPAMQPRARMQEDDAPVYTPQGLQPLSQVNPGQQWQNPMNGFSPNGYVDPRRSWNNDISGAVNPLFRQFRTGQSSIYSPGEGPRTNFNRFR